MAPLHFEWNPALDLGIYDLQQEIQCFAQNTTGSGHRCRRVISNVIRIAMIHEYISDMTSRTPDLVTDAELSVLSECLCCPEVHAHDSMAFEHVFRVLKGQLDRITKLYQRWKSIAVSNSRCALQKRVQFLSLENKGMKEENARLKEQNILSKENISKLEKVSYDILGWIFDFQHSTSLDGAYDSLEDRVFDLFAVGGQTVVDVYPLMKDALQAVKTSREWHGRENSAAIRTQESEAALKIQLQEAEVDTLRQTAMTFATIYMAHQYHSTFFAWILADVRQDPCAQLDSQVGTASPGNHMKPTHTEELSGRISRLDDNMKNLTTCKSIDRRSPYNHIVQHAYVCRPVQELVTGYTTDDSLLADHQTRTMATTIQGRRANTENHILSNRLDEQPSGTTRMLEWRSDLPLHMSTTTPYEDRTRMQDPTMVAVDHHRTQTYMRLWKALWQLLRPSRVCYL